MATSTIDHMECAVLPLHFPVGAAGCAAHATLFLALGLTSAVGTVVLPVEFHLFTDSF